MEGLARGGVGTWRCWHVEGLAHGGVGTWRGWHVEGLAHGGVGTWRCWHVEGLAHGGGRASWPSPHAQCLQTQSTLRKAVT